MQNHFVLVYLHKVQHLNKKRSLKINLCVALSFLKGYNFLHLRSLANFIDKECHLASMMRIHGVEGGFRFLPSNNFLQR